eukprot:m.433055 g.433055  ORF g.433055 m.433055 type:complete len:486 (+) comp17521_c0_seq1:1888-3345(+)
MVHHAGGKVTLPRAAGPNRGAMGGGEAERRMRSRSWFGGCLFAAQLFGLVALVPMSSAENATGVEMGAFKAWCAEVGIGLNNVDWKQGATDSERLTVTSASLTKGEPVLSVPLSTVLNIEHALGDPVLGPVWDSEGGAKLSDLDVVAAYIVYERHKASDSRWQQYLDFLPTAYPTNPLYFDDEVLSQLRGLSVKPFVQRRREQVDASFAAVQAVVAAQDPEQNLFKAGLLTVERFRWATATVRSRSHLISLKDGTGKWHKAMCMVPAADMLNMAVDPTDANVECKTDASGGVDLSQQFFLCTATKDIPAGAELATVYTGSPGRRADGRLLLEYGFVPESNPSFAVDMLPPSTLKPRLASAENALKTLPEFLVLDPVLWTADPASFIRTFLFFFRGLMLEKADTKGQSTEALASALVRKAPISEDNERLALAKASEFLDDAHNLADVYEPADTDCTAELVSAAKRLRAKELSAIDGGRRFINNYKS